MTTQYYLAGNALIGDALLSVGWYLPTERQFDRHVVVCNHYNREVYEFLRDHTTHVIDEIIVLDDYERLRIWPDFDAYCDKIDAQYSTERPPVRLAWPLAFGDEGHHAQAIPLVPRSHGPRVVDGPYVTMQIDSVHRWKHMHHLAEVQSPLPIVCVTRTNERCHPAHAVRVQDQHLSRVAEVLLGSAAHLGIASSVTRFAAQLGVPTVMCCTDPTTAQNVGLQRTPGRHFTLIRPSVEQAQAALTELAETATAQAPPDVLDQSGRPDPAP